MNAGVVSLLLALPVLACSQPLAPSAAYDVLIRGCRIVDGGGNPWFHVDVATQGDRIAAVWKLGGASARRVIDATGLVVSPGFIDLDTYSDSGTHWRLAAEV